MHTDKVKVKSNPAAYPAFGSGGKMPNVFPSVSGKAAVFFAVPQKRPRHNKAPTAFVRSIEIPDFDAIAKKIADYVILL